MLYSCGGPSSRKNFVFTSDEIDGSTGEITLYSYDVRNSVNRNDPKRITIQCFLRYKPRCEKDLSDFSVERSLHFVVLT